MNKIHKLLSEGTVPLVHINQCLVQTQGKNGQKSSGMWQTGLL